ncbi:MAG: hypothetical protein EAZ92_00245 [Candidatus Kapaibacterium sp.]|nr:MAG: hypothetical protein EAZ92_00245 [Candidatus Kapabacteria bacterium]
MKSIWIRFVCAICTVCVCIGFSSAVFAQREQAGIRYEFFGPRSIPAATPNLFNGGQVGMSLLTINGGFQLQLDKEGSSVLNNQFIYRNATANFPTSKDAQGNFTNTSLTGHAIYYEGLFLQTLSEKFQLALAVRAGLFSDMNNIGLSHFRAEPIAFLDWFVDDKFILGAGFAYGTSNFGRLVNTPLLHIYWIPSPEILVDALLPTRLDVWYYPTKQLDVGLSIALNGAQFQLGQAPNIQGIDRTLTAPSVNSGLVRRTADIDQFYFANATIGPNIRYNVFEKTYISLEGGYSLVRRLGFDNFAPHSGIIAGGRTDTDYIVNYFRGFDFGVNTWFVRAGIQIMY